MEGVMDQGPPLPFQGALTTPKVRRLERMYLTKRMLHPATFAIWWQLETHGNKGQLAFVYPVSLFSFL